MTALVYFVFLGGFCVLIFIPLLFTCLNSSLVSSFACYHTRIYHITKLILWFLPEGTFAPFTHGAISQGIDGGQGKNATEASGGFYT